MDKRDETLTDVPSNRRVDRSGDDDDALGGVESERRRTSRFDAASRVDRAFGERRGELLARFVHLPSSDAFTSAHLRVAVSFCLCCGRRLFG